MQQKINKIIYNTLKLTNKLHKTQKEQAFTNAIA